MDPAVAAFVGMRGSLNGPPPLQAPQTPDYSGLGGQVPTPLSGGAGARVGGVGGSGALGPDRNGVNLVQFGPVQLDDDVIAKMSALSKQFPGLRITSGYRDPADNSRVGGVPNSNHLTGHAADWVGSASDMANALAWAKSNGATEALVHNIGSGMHLHLSF